MERDMRGCLPEPLSPLWDRLESLDTALLSSMQDAAQDARERLGQERSELLRTLCEAIGRLEDPALQQRLLGDLLDANTALQSHGSQALAEAAALMASGNAKRRAISAYGEQHAKP